MPPESRLASFYKVANILARFRENKEVDRRLAHVTGRFWRNMSQEKWRVIVGPNKHPLEVCTATPFWAGFIVGSMVRTGGFQNPRSEPIKTRKKAKKK